jgi:hypothetical protein
LISLRSTRSDVSNCCPAQAWHSAPSRERLADEELLCFFDSRPALPDPDQLLDDSGGFIFKRALGVAHAGPLVHGCFRVS